MEPNRYSRTPLFAISVILFWILSIPCMALEPREIVVIANKRVADSGALAQFYMKKRNIPKSNLLQLEISEGEECTREEYNEKGSSDSSQISRGKKICQPHPLSRNYIRSSIENLWVEIDATRRESS